MKTAGLIITALLLLVISVLAWRSWLSRQDPPALGVNGSALSDCGERPNCVSSQASDAAHRVAPLSYVGGRAQTQARLQALLTQLPRMTAVQTTADYWRYTQTSALFRFIDDVEFYFDDAQAAVQVRSASRVGYSDLGVNRKRIEAMRVGLQH